MWKVPNVCITEAWFLNVACSRSFLNRYVLLALSVTSPPDSFASVAAVYLRYIVFFCDMYYTSNPSQRKSIEHTRPLHFPDDVLPCD
jgi:hypothetical protein